MRGKGVAQGLLNQAHSGLSNAENIYNSLPSWVLSPEILAVEAAKNISNSALDLANKGLTDTQNVTRGIKSLAEKVGGSQLPIRVKKAVFSTQLDSIEKMSFQSTFTLQYMDANGAWREANQTLLFDFNNLNKTAESLVKALLPIPQL